MSVWKVFHTATERLNAFGRYAMNRKQVFVGASVLGLLLALAAGVTLAQEPDSPEGGVQPQGNLAIASIMTNTISYQGMLTEGDSPVDGSRDMIFRLYSDGGCSAQVGDDIDVGSVSVNDGFFDVNLPIDHDDFNGQALWLEAEVGGTAIGCEEIQPAPYALSLRPGATISTSTWLQQFPHVQGSLGSSTIWKLGDVERSGMPPMVDSVYGVRGHAPGSAAVDAYGIEGSAETTTGEAYGIYGNATATEVGGISYGVYGLGDDYGVYGESTDGAGVKGESANSYGVYGISANSIGVYAWSDNHRGVHSYSGSADHAAVYACNNNGPAIEADCSGIIKSAAETEIAVSPMKTVVDPSLTGNPEVRPYLNGTVVLRPSASGEHFAYVPVDLTSQLFGVPQMLKSITVCYDLDRTSSYINDLFVYYTGDGGGRVELISDPTNRTSTSWECYEVSDPSPGVIGGPVFIRFDLQYGGTGGSHEVHIGKIVLTLVEE